MRRRDALLALAGSASIGLAGCSGGGTEDTGPTTTGTGDGPTATGTDGGPAGADGDPDGEVTGLEGLGIELLEYDHEIRDRGTDTRNENEQAYVVYGRLRLTIDEYVNVEIGYEFLDDAGERLSYYETTKLMQQGDIWEFEGAYSGPADEPAGYVLSIGCTANSDCSV